MEPKQSKLLIKANSKVKVKIKFAPVYEYAVGEFFLYVSCEKGAQLIQLKVTYELNENKLQSENAVNNNYQDNDNNNLDNNNMEIEIRNK